MGELDPVTLLAARFRAGISAAFPSVVDPEPLIAPSKNPKFGEFQCNAAMSLSKVVGQPPRDVALALVRSVDVAGLCEPLSEASVAGPGFINLTLLPGTLASLLDTMDRPGLGVTPIGAGRPIVVDLCGVNLAKQMHVGHIRATFIGDALARTFERLGYLVTRQNHVGDWGLNIAMVVAKLAELEARGERVDSLTLSDIEQLYKRAQSECSADERGLAAVKRFDLGPKALAELSAQVEGAREAMAGAKRTLVQLQAREPRTFALWQRVADVTMRECLDICRRMDVNVTAEHTAGESSYADELAPMVDELVARGVAEIDDGAMVIRVEGVEEPCLIRKSDGGFLYATTDLAAIKRRVGTIGADRVIYCVDARQSLHFRQVFGAAKAAGLTARAAGGPASLEHAAFGTILGEDGKPFKTRSGESVRLADLVGEAVDRAAGVLDQLLAGSEAGAAIGADERASIASAVGIAALKYTDLSSDRVKDYVFSFERMLAFEGNTGPYLLYALVRTKNVQRKAHSELGLGPDAFARAPIMVVQPEEKTLALTLLRWPSVLRSVAEALEPHRLCQFLYDLATSFSAFYSACKVLHAPDEASRLSRLRLCSLCERVLEDGLHVLGIRTIERM
jgi:arginyl-tRNA synthetase